MLAESAVLNTVDNTLGLSREAGSFTCGSLFVKCNSAEADQLLATLRVIYGNVILNGPVQGEYIYDFV
jgi:hypothetical protein